MAAQEISKYLTINELTALHTKTLSKVKIGDEVRYLKDADLRQIVAGFNPSLVTGTVAEALTDGGTGFATAGTVKSYVDQLVSAGLVIVVDNKAADKMEPATAASKTTTGKLYLVSSTDATDGTYVEFVTVTGGTEETPTYSWEQIGTTKTDLSGYIPNTATVAGVSFGEDNAITADELAGATALNLKALAHKDSASGTVSTIDSITMKESTVTGSATVGTTSATVDSTGKYTPAGSVTAAAKNDGDILIGGSVSVSVKDATSKSEATVSADAYTPAGSVAIAKDDANGTQITGSVSAPTITVTPATDTHTYTTVTDAGTGYSITAGSATGTFATSGINAAVDKDDDEMLVFTTASTDAVAYTAPVLSGSLPTFKTDNTMNYVTGITSAEASTPTFTGDKFKASFTGTEEANMKVTKVEYFKQEIDSAEFTGTKGGLTFAGTEGTVNVSGSYDKADGTATVTGKVTPEVDTYTRTDKTVNVQ